MPIKFTTRFVQSLKPSETEQTYAWPSQKTLASKTGLSRQTVNKSIKRLVKMKILVSERRTDKGKSTSNLYRINHVARADTQTNNVAQNDNEVSISDTEVCKGGLHKPLATLNEPLDSVNSTGKGNAGLPIAKTSNDNTKQFSGLPKTPKQFRSLSWPIQEYYALNKPALMADLKSQGLDWDRFKK